MEDFEGGDVVSETEGGGTDAGEETAESTGDHSDIDTVDDTEDDVLDDFGDVGFRFGHIPRHHFEGSEKLKPPQLLTKWHATLFPVEVDLISELNASNLFFINAESLICDLLLSEEVKFEEDTQFLRLTNSIEQILSNIRSCGGVFRLIFFDGMKQLFGSVFGESVWAFRQAFLMHCATVGLDHSVFPHWYSPKWKDHVAKWRPSFFLVSNATIEIEEPDEDDEEDEEEAEQRLKFSCVLYSQIVSLLSYKTHVALLRGMQRKGNRMMAFTIEPDCYDVLIERKAAEDLLSVLEEDDDEEEEEDGDIVQDLRDFAKRSGEHVDTSAHLRSFVAVQFAKNTLAMCAKAGKKGEAQVTKVLMQLVTKVLLLQEMMLRQIQLDKRAYSLNDADEWTLYQDSISNALEKYFTLTGELLAKLQKKLPLEDLPLEACDFFDGRLYRQIFQVTVAKGLAEEKGVVTSEFFGWSKFVQEELEFLWKETGSSEPFFPISVAELKSIKGIQPPDMPEQEEPGEVPELVDIQSGFAEVLWEASGAKFDKIDIVEPTERQPSNELWDPSKINWNKTGRIDSFKAEETMEENEAEKKMKKVLAAKGKITAWDIAFKQKFENKKKQLALKSLQSYSDSLTDSHKLHPPIILKEDKTKGKDKKDDKEDKAKGKDKKDDKEDKAKGKDKKDAKGEDDKEVKMSAKQKELLEKRHREEHEKMLEKDRKAFGEFEKRANAMADILSAQKLEHELVDFFLGFNRVTDSFVGLPVLTSAIKSSEVQTKVMIAVVKAIRASVKKMQLDKTVDVTLLQQRSLVCYIYYILQESFRMLKKDLDGKAVKLYQEMLASIGFPKGAAQIFDEWVKAQVDAAGKGAAEAGEAAEKKGKDKDKDKDDKKKGKDKDKDDKKKGKDKDKAAKEEASGAVSSEALEQYRATKSVDLLWSGVGADEFAFQLMYMGPQMPRTVGNAKDPLGRVNFRPDGWQKELLDIVDARKSALIVAPTASGKTFIGYYVMDKVLRDDNEGVAVYVAPSKALVNQVSAEVYARFNSKTYPAHSKYELLGSFLREFNMAGGYAEQGKWKNCQILVTVPHILEMLLTSTETQDWVTRLRYIVFDEVHCIGEQEGGSQWEHCMQMIPCPFIALSATVADPSFFHGWLNRVSDLKTQPEVKLVQHTERWNDLYKYVFVDGVVRPMHPFCALVEQSVRLHGLASDLTLTPQEMIQLFQQVRKLIGSVPEWDRLAPVLYWGSGYGILTKADARKYEKELVDTFLKILRADKLTSEDFQKLTLTLQGEQVLDKAAFSPPPRAPQQGGTETDITQLMQKSAYLQASSIEKLCRNLDEAKMLPGIIFNFQRKDIEKMLQRLVKQLQDSQFNKYFGNEEAKTRSKKIMEKVEADYKKKVEAYEAAQKMLASKGQENKSARKANDGEGGLNKEIEANDVSTDARMEAPVQPVALDDELFIDPEFTFHGQKALGVWQDDIEDMLKGLHGKVQKVYVDALRRGIGMHHEGNKRAYSTAVEILFRRGYLRVVFATGTLALGINMPCRTTVFCGDSVLLNGLMYRQMSGRAGRRGFDLLGQVIFWDMGFSRLRNLIASDLPSLTGEFVLSPSMLLRVLHQWEMMLLDEEKKKPMPRDKKDFAQSFVASFSVPFFRSETAALKEQVTYHTRFMMEFLYEQHLLDTRGCTVNLANFAAHLFEIEPANFIIARLLSAGLFHKYLTKAAKSVKKGIRRTHLTVRLTEILAWFLYRRRLPNVIPADGTKRKKNHPSADCPRLPPLPKAFLDEVSKYNGEVLSLFQRLSWAVTRTQKIGERDLTLPLSRTGFRKGKDSRGEAFDGEPEYLQLYSKQLVRSKARSPFAAIAGKGDHFSSPVELVNSVRQVIHLDLNGLPMLLPPMAGTAATDNENDIEATNSWAVDFMIHGTMRYLWEDNAIDSSKAWKLISEFSSKIKMMVDALKALRIEKEDIVIDTLENLAAEMQARLWGKK